MTGSLYRPLVQGSAARPEDACHLAGGPMWFTHVRVLRRRGPACVVPARDIPKQVLARITAPRPPIAGLDLSQPRIMGILNVTPDSFSDGGRHLAAETAIGAAMDMAGSGAAILDIGGESTRPGATPVHADEEAARILPVIEGIRARSDVVVSVDTRKAVVARAALAAGADLINDVSGLTHDRDMVATCHAAGAPVCVMHSRGDPETMQNDPVYDSVVHDVHDSLQARLAWLEAAGIPRAHVLVDPGIGFGKTLAHNLALLRDIGVLHGLGAGILLGVSRKGFIGRIGQEPRAEARAPGSIAVGLAALAQGVQVLRVHDVAQTAQAVRLWQAMQDAGQDAGAETG
ncbi:MAG: dihydropteroate synthase [Marinibacterium sp.]